MSDDLHGVMRSATENLHPNIGKLTAGGIERGVRKRRVRRISQIAGAAAGVTAVFGAVAMVNTAGHGGSAANVSAASGAAVAAQTSPHAVAGTEAAPAQNKPTAPPVSGEDMATWLKQALEPYHFTDEVVGHKSGSDDTAGPFAVVAIGYSGGHGSVSLNISRSPWSLQHMGSPLPQYITEQNLNDGSHLVVFDGPEWPAGNGDPTAKRLDVSWYRTDGTMIDMMVLNETQEKGATTASGLGLTAAEAAKIVQSPVWDKAIAAVLTKPAPAVPKDPGGLKGTELQRKLAGPGNGNASSPAAPTSR